MAELENKVKLEGWSCKLTKATKETLTELQNSGDFATVNQMMETLIERYYSPIKANDQSEKITELEKKLLEKKNLNNLSNENAKELEFQLNQTKEELEISISECEKLVKERDELEQKYINESVKAELPENGHVVVFDPINWEIVKFVAEREANKRKQPWTVDDVINYFIHFRFEKGTLNGDLNSVSDSEIKKIKNELNEE